MGNKNAKKEDLKECLSLIKKDEEWEEISKELKKGWKRWGERCAKLVEM